MGSNHLRDAQVLPSSSSPSSTVGQRSLVGAALIWEVPVHANMQCSQMQSGAILANPVSVDAEMWRVMQQKVICQFCRVLYGALGDGARSGGCNGGILLAAMMVEDSGCRCRRRRRW